MAIKYLKSIIWLFILCLGLSAAAPAHAVCNTPSGVAGQIVYNSTGKIFQYCNDTIWVTMNLIPGSGSGGCNTPSANEGGIIYNIDGRTPQGCAGDQWRAFGIPNGSAQYSSFSASGGITCGIRPPGELYCWGTNYAGRLGTGDLVLACCLPIQEPRRVGTVGTSTLWSDWVYIYAAHTACGIRANGTAWCWGYGANGTRGDGTVTTEINTPVQVGTVGTGTIFTDWVKIVPDSMTTCGIRANGTAWCWGDRSSGQIGNGTTSATRITTPVQVGTAGSSTIFTDWVDISSKSSTSCGVRATGQAYCWGSGANGELGRNSTAASNIPVLVGTAGTGTNFTNWLKIVRVNASITCGLRSNGQIWCWGLNYDGQLGNGTTTDSLYPVRVGTAGTSTLWSDWTSITTNGTSPCGNRADGSSWCWGFGSYGELGDGTYGNYPYPRPLGGGPYTSLSHDCGLRADGTIRCRGYNILRGSLGVEDQERTPTYKAFPTLVVGGNKWQKIVANQDYWYPGDNATCAIDTAGSAWCWGDNSGIYNSSSYDQGNLGNGSLTLPAASPSPSLVVGGHQWIDIGVQQDYGCGIRSDGAVLCWGNHTTATPTQISAPGDVFTQISEDGSCAVRNDGAAYCGFAPGGTPALVAGGIVFKTIDKDYLNQCGIDINDDAYCWGNGGDGQLGNGGTSNSATPVLVSGGHKWKQIGVGYNSVCGITMDNTGMCWGAYGWESNLGYGYDIVYDHTVPNPVNSDQKFIDIRMGSTEMGCGVTIYNKIYCWSGYAGPAMGTGYNYDDGPAEYDSPYPISSNLEYKSVSVGDDYVCAISSNDDAYCWGHNEAGNLGIGKLPYPPEPLTTTCPHLARPAGTIAYDSASNIMQFCDGVAWQRIGR